MSSPLIWGTPAKLLADSLDINGFSWLISGNVDPSATATLGPLGSIYLSRLNGNLYRKLDAGTTTNWAQVASASTTAQTVQRFATAGSFTYTKPTSPSPIFLEILVQGAGAGGGGNGSSAGNGTAGTASSFGTTIAASNGGTGGLSNGNGGSGQAGGTATGTATLIFSTTGQSGSNSSNLLVNAVGANGGQSAYFGGGGLGGGSANAGVAAQPNTGSGGGGAGGGGSIGPGGGGGAGGLFHGLLTGVLSSTYPIVVGAKGTGGGAGGGGFAGGNGADGIVIVREYY